MPPLVDITGQTFGRLTVIEQAGRDNKGGVLWLCICRCGERRVVRGYNLRSGGTRSCGCLNSEVCATLAVKRNTTHGHAPRVVGSHTPTYVSWRSMRQRCNNPSAKSYPHYGGRGITVCDRWMDSFENFLADMGERPEGHTLDRIDPNGNYEPDNCRWATPEEQRANRRKS